ncbi:MAG: tRNA lysidine(34) synthetase TilS [Candidatus Izemoplasmatales bacterium]
MVLKFNQSLFVKHGSYVVAVSGGIDSMVLLSLMNALKDELHLTLYALHMNYHKRDSALRDQQIVEKYCKNNNIECMIADFIDSPFGNFQQEARNQRYNQLYHFSKKVGAEAICLAHHADDQMETILMRLNRGSSFVGYAGMKEVSLYKDMPLFRPLLAESKDNIIAFAKEMNIPFGFDETNDQDEYTRNRFRHTITPFLKKENPKALQKWNEFSEDILDSYHLISKLSNQFLEEFLVSNNERYQIELNRFLGEEKIIQKDILKKLVNLASKNATELTKEHMEDIYKIIHSSKPNLKKKLDQHLFIQKSYQVLSFQEKEMKPNSYEFKLTTFGEVSLPNDYIITISQNERNNSGKTIELWYNNLDSLFPITFRSRKDKDTIRLTYGTKKLKDFFIDKKIPLIERNELPLIIDATGEIICIPNIYTFKPDVRETKIYITYQKG